MSLWALSSLALSLLLTVSGGAPGGEKDPPATHEPAPGIRIERADPAGAAELRRRLATWRGRYRERLAGLRRESEELFGALEGSSLAASAQHCERVLEQHARLDRRGLFSSSDVRVDRILFGSLQRFGSGASSCLAGRYLEAYRLLHEARSGLAWIDRHVASRLRPRIPLPGLGE